VAYVRKTRDEWEIQGDHGHGLGWELETTEMSWKEAKAQLKTYRENCPGVPFRAVKKRERINQS
jgi:hypothetical protein